MEKQQRYKIQALLGTGWEDYYMGPFQLDEANRLISQEIARYYSQPETSTLADRNRWRVVEIGEAQ